MKTDVAVIRESIGRIVSMLTKQSIKVTQRGTNAYVKYHPKTGAILEVNIPYIPDDATDEFISAIQGFLDHEVGHVLFSDFEVLKKATLEGKRVANLHNVVEDVYVERKMSEAFRGSGVNLEATRKFYLEKIARPKIAEALAAGNVEAARGYATVAAIRAWGGQTTAADFINEPAMAELVAPVAEKLGKELMEKLGRCKSSNECLDVARECLKKLEKPKAEAPKPEEKGEKGEGEPSESEEGDSEAEGESSKGKSSVEKDDSGKEREEKLDKVDGEPEDAEAGDSGGKDKSDKEGTSDDPEAESDSEKPEPTDKKDSEELGDTGTSSGGTTESDDGTDSEDKESGSGGSASGDEPSDTEDSDGATGEVEGTPAEPELDPLADMFDTERDFDKDMSEELSKEAKRELDDSNYAVFSTDWDKVAPAPMARDVKTIAKLDASIKDKIGVMQKHLERGIAAKARRAWNTGMTRGRIAPSSLFKTSVGDDRVFRQRFETKARNTAISLVVDCSGSMSGGRIRIAGEATYALASVLERIKVAYEVIGFTSTDSREMMELMYQDAESHGTSMHRMGWARVEPLYMPVFKPFNSKLDTNARSRIAHLTENPGWLSQNIDGECIKLAARRLVQQKAERHVMIVLSDGEPCCMSGKGLAPHLKKTVAELTKQNVETIGIGIQTSAVKHFYPKHVVINDTAELPTRVMAELTKILLAA